MKKKRPQEMIELAIDAIGFEGKAIARKNNMVYFVEGAVPGDTVRARIIRKKRSYVTARATEILTSSSTRVEPVCRYFGDCGGCKWQNLEYAEQIRWKKQHVSDAFERLAKVEFGELHDTLPAPGQYWYRNKMEFSFGDSRWLTQKEIESGQEFEKEFALGLHVPGRFDKIIDIEECFLQSPESNTILNAVRNAAKERNVTIFETRNHTGFLRNLVIRNSLATGAIMVILVTSPPASAAEYSLLDWFENRFANEVQQVTTAVHAVSTSKSTVAVGEPRTVFGSGTISEYLCDVEFRISPFSFFQTNPAQAARLFEIALEFAQLTSNSVVWDLYCGGGSISLSAARQCKKVVGIELNDAAIADARANAEHNGIMNATFYTADIKDALCGELRTELPEPDVVIVDPPRAGMHPNVVEALLHSGAPRIVYVSCNPATQARDCAILAEHYTVNAIQPVDMFPNTFHIESVAVLERKPPDN